VCGCDVDRNAVIGALMSRQDLLMPAEDSLTTKSSSSISSDVPTQCDSSCPTTVVTTATETATSGPVDVGDVSVTLSVPVDIVSSLSPAVDNNQSVSSLVSINGHYFTQ